MTNLESLRKHFQESIKFFQSRVDEVKQEIHRDLSKTQKRAQPYVPFNDFKGHQNDSQ